MLGFLGTAGARLRHPTVLGNGLLAARLQHALAPALCRGTTAPTRHKQQRGYDDDRDHDDHDNQSSGHTLNLLRLFQGGFPLTGG